jgi:Tfp pilus assembly protein PilF
MAAMEIRRIAWVGLAAAALAACGGSNKEPETAAKATPTTAPAAAPAPGSGTTPAPDMPAGGGGAVTVSDNVTKGMRALDGGDLVAAKAYFDAALKKNPKDVDALYYLGYTAEKSGDKDGAVKAYRDALTIRHDHEGAALNLSGLDDEAQRFDEAVAVCKNALSKHPDNAALHLNLGIALASKADQAGATKEFDEALRIVQNEPMFHIVYGHWLGEWKQADAALAQLRAARPLAGDDVGLLASIAHELHHIRAFADCVPTLDKAIALKDAAELRTERAACKIGANDAAGALADLQAAVAREPNYAPAHYYLGNSLAMAGQFKEAVAEYQAFLKLMPSGPLAKSATEKIRLAKAKGGLK